MNINTKEYRAGFIVGVQDGAEDKSTDIANHSVSWLKGYAQGHLDWMGTVSPLANECGIRAELQGYHGQANFKFPKP